MLQYSSNTTRRKMANTKKATVVHDDGGAELKLKFRLSGQIFKVHKGMIHVSKETNEYEAIFKSNKIRSKEKDNDGPRYNLRPRRR